MQGSFAENYGEQMFSHEVQGNQTQSTLQSEIIQLFIRNKIT